jgi:GC-rich sequence DNA-binding factor
MSSSRARNFRRRAGDDDDDNNNNNQNDDVKVTTKTTTPAPKPKPKKLLSFADDEDALIPSRSTSSSSKRPTKLSASSHKVTSRTDRRAHSSASVASNVQPQAGTYTKEALLQLQKNTRTLAPSLPSSTEPAIVLKGLLKPPDDDDDHPAISQTLKRNDDESENDDHNEENNRERRDAQTQFASLGIGKSKDSLIPDQATIEAIRAKRERLRQSRAAAPDYISLDGGSNHGEAEGLSDEEPEFRGRIAMFGEKKKTEPAETKKTKKGVFEDDDGDGREVSVHFAKDSENGEEDEDEEEKIWEEEQFRKGLGKRMDDGTSRVVVTATVPVVHSLQQHKSVYPATVPSAVVAASIGGAIGASQGLDAPMSIPQQAEVARKALQENVRRLKVWNAYLIAQIEPGNLFRHLVWCFCDFFFVPLGV